MHDVTKSENVEQRKRSNGEKPETGVSERIFSGNSHEKSKWLSKPSKESELNCDMKAKCFRQAPLFAIIGVLAFISILPMG